jgi:hypothetical protein
VREGRGPAMLSGRPGGVKPRRARKPPAAETHVPGRVFLAIRTTEPPLRGKTNDTRSVKHRM